VKHGLFLGLIAVLLVGGRSNTIVMAAQDAPTGVAGTTVPSQTDPNATIEKEASAGNWWGMTDWPAERKAVGLNILTLGTIATIGAAKWDYGSTAFHFEDEGWFDHDTPDGGADKLGHAFLGYTLTGGFSWAYRQWGFSDDEAFVRGALNSVMITTSIEIGDGFSKSQGFCWQDEVADIAGVGIAYLRYRVPGIREKVDFRLEWFPSKSFHKKWDPFTDYSGQKNVVALKPSGFFDTEDPFWKAIEFQIGYYTRGYEGVDRPYYPHENRNLYVAIGLNMAYLVEKFTGHTAYGLLEYYQVPYTYMSAVDHMD
jgi:hypothetical protein